MELKLLVFITFQKSIINLSKIESVNALSRRITQKNITIEEIESELNQIDTMSDYSFFWRLVAYTLGASGFSYALVVL